MATIALARTVDCPTCGARADDTCFDLGRRTRMEQVHADRLRKAQHEKEQAEADLLTKLDLLAREIESLPSRYTRMQGVNGDRVADLLSDDTYKLGHQMRELIAEARKAQS